jgi:uncharacterized membrane protein
MRVRLRHAWEIVGTNYWFVPSVMTLAAAGAALVMLHIDRIYFPADIHAFWLYSGGADGAKTLLSTVAGSIITVAGVVFSITIAALTQASAHVRAGPGVCHPPDGRGRGTCIISGNQRSIHRDKLH